MANFNPNMIVPAAKSSEFAKAGEQGRTAKAILIDGINKQIELWKKPNEAGRRWFQVGQKEVCLTLRVNNKPLPIVGNETKVVVPMDHFEAAMAHLKGLVEKGDMDAVLAEADKGITARREKLRETRASNKSK